MLAVRHALARTRAKATSAVRPARAPAPPPGTSPPVHHRARAPAPSSPAPRQCCPFVMPIAKAGRRRISGGASAPGGRIGGRNDLQNEPPPPPTQEADEKRSTVERVLDFGETMYYTHVSVCARAHVHTDRHTQRVLCRVDFMCQRRNGLFGMLTIHFNTYTHTSHTASEFDVPEEERQLLPSGLFGMRSIHLKANMRSIHRKAPTLALLSGCGEWQTKNS